MDIRFRQASAITYQEYLNLFNKEPDSPKLLPLENPIDQVSDLELTPVKKLQQCALYTQSERQIPVAKPFQKRGN